jgi:PAS domain S-box-containing protein
MAWVGQVRPGEDHLSVAAHAGASPDTVAIITTLFETPASSCAFTQRAFAGGRLAVCNDIAGDPLAQSWRDAALARGYRSMISLPLTASGRRVGVFNLYAGEPGFFDDDEVKLLAGLAGDIGFALEVTERERERERAEAALRISEERLRELAETIEDVFWVADPVGERLLYISPAYERIWGRPRQPLYESAAVWADSVHPDDLGRMRADRARAYGGKVSDADYRIIRPDGDVRWIRSRTFPVHTEHGGVVRLVGVARDLTERRRLEEHLRRAQTLEATGQLAAGVAHDFNNILTVILGGCGVLETALGPHSPAVADVRQMAAAAARGASLTAQLLAFTRQQTISPVVLDLATHLRSVTGILRRTLPEHITLEVASAANAWPVLADPAQIDQLVLNLAVNARDAMPAGGAITIDVADVVLDEAACAGRVGLEPGGRRGPSSRSSPPRAKTAAPASGWRRCTAS